MHRPHMLQRTLRHCGPLRYQVLSPMSAIVQLMHTPEQIALVVCMLFRVTGQRLRVLDRAPRGAAAPGRSAKSDHTDQEHDGRSALSYRAVVPSQSTETPAL